MAFVIAIPASLFGFLAAIIQFVWFDATLMQAALLYLGIGLALPTALLAAIAVSSLLGSDRKEPKLI